MGVDASGGFGFTSRKKSSVAVIIILASTCSEHTVFVTVFMTVLRPKNAVFQASFPSKHISERIWTVQLLTQDPHC